MRRLIRTATASRLQLVSLHASCSRRVFSTNGLKIWEYHVSDETSSSTNHDGEENANKKKRLARKATLYTPSAETNGGWDVLKTRLGSADERLAVEKIENLTVQPEHHIIRHFLPAGYPDSVAPGYRNYALHNFAANSCGFAAMVLSTQALLLAVGVGSATAAPMAGAMNWVLKDGIGELGAVLFASRLGSAATGSSIDTDPKRWKVASAIWMDLATFLEILSPLFPGYFLPIASVANVGKNIGWLTASASRAAIHQSLSQRRNLGDITAKAESQSIAASIVGTALGIGLSPLTQGEVAKVATGFAVLALVHQYCTYKSLRFVQLKSLNRHRLNLVTEEFIRSYVVPRGIAGLEAERTVELQEEQASSTLVSSEQQRHAVLSPAELAQIEGFVPFISKDDTMEWLTIGCKLDELFPDQVSFDDARNNFIGERERYLVNCDIEDSSRTANIRLTYLENAVASDIIRGMLHAHILRAYSKKIIELPDGQDVRKASHGVMAESYDAFVEALEDSGWEIAAVQVEAVSAVRLRIET